MTISSAVTFLLIPSAICENWEKYDCNDVTPRNFLSDSCHLLNRYMDRFSLPHPHHK